MATVSTYRCPVDPERCPPANGPRFCTNHQGVKLERVRSSAAPPPSPAPDPQQQVHDRAAEPGSAPGTTAAQPTGTRPPPGMFRSAPTTLQSAPGTGGAATGAGAAACVRILGRTLIVPPDGLELGRDSPACADIPGMADLTQVSRHHARLYYDGERLMVRDLDSVNHTFVDGVEIEAPTPLDPGRSLRLGQDVPVEVDRLRLDPFGLPL